MHSYQECAFNVANVGGKQNGSFAGHDFVQRAQDSQVLMQHRPEMRIQNIAAPAMEHD